MLNITRLRVRHDYSDTTFDHAIIVQADGLGFYRQLFVRNGTRASFEDDAIECTIALLQRIS